MNNIMLQKKERKMLMTDEMVLFITIMLMRFLGEIIKTGIQE